jgi:hypothetical protein
MNELEDVPLQLGSVHSLCTASARSTRRFVGRGRCLFQSVLHMIVRPSTTSASTSAPRARVGATRFGWNIMGTDAVVTRKPGHAAGVYRGFFF